jgi:hypothetical protein
MRAVSYNQSLLMPIPTRGCPNIAVVFVQGPYLVRSAQLTGSTLTLTGDIINGTDIDVFAPRAVKTVVWNGLRLGVSPTPYGSLHASLQKARSITLTPFTTWKFNDSLPERFLDYDDSGLGWVGKQ